MITIKINDLVNCTDALRALSEKDMKAKLAYSTAKLLKVADTEMSGFNDARMKLIEKYGNKDENGNLIKDDKDNVKIDNENIAEFSEELNDLLDTQVELNANKLKLSMLETLDFSPAEMFALEPLIEDDTEPEEV